MGIPTGYRAVAKTARMKMVLERSASGHVCSVCVCVFVCVCVCVCVVCVSEKDCKSMCAK
jgi:hypothetical protein